MFNCSAQFYKIRSPLCEFIRVSHRSEQRMMSSVVKNCQSVQITDKKGK